MKKFLAAQHQELQHVERQRLDLRASEFQEVGPGKAREGGGRHLVRYSRAREGGGRHLVRYSMVSGASKVLHYLWAGNNYSGKAVKNLDGRTDGRTSTPRSLRYDILVILYNSARSNDSIDTSAVDIFNPISPGP